MKRVCVFCGSSIGLDPAFAAAARSLGLELVRRGLELVFGAGRNGLMGALADATLAAGSHVTGVIPEHLATRELMHPELTTLHVVGDMHARKALMARLADGFIALPGGYGTLEELFEVVTWAQLGLHAKPVGLLEVNGFYAPMIEMLDGLVRAGFVSPSARSIVSVDDDPGRLLEALQARRAAELGASNLVSG